MPASCCDETDLLAHDLFRKPLHTFRDHALIRHAVARRKGVKPLIAQHVRGECERAEHVGKCSIADIKAARISTERRHHETHAIGCKAAAADGAAAMRHPCDRMKVAANLPVTA